MIGAFAAFGVDFNLAVLAVLAYRAHLLLAADAPGRDRLLPAAPHGGSLARRRRVSGGRGGGGARPGRSRLTGPLTRR